VADNGVDKTLTGNTPQTDRPDFYVRSDGEAILGTGYRAFGRDSNVDEALSGMNHLNKLFYGYKKNLKRER
jgi:hypothetical protein